MEVGVARQARLTVRGRWCAEEGRGEVDGEEEMGNVCGFRPRSGRRVRSVMRRRW
jgi:hypothetical protein